MSAATPLDPVDEEDLERLAIREEAALGVALTMFSAHDKPAGARVATTWPDWIEEVERDLQQPHDGRGWAPATFSNDQRSKANVEAIDALVYDLEPVAKDAPDPERRGDPYLAAHVFAFAFGVVHTTRSHRPEAPRCRAILPLDRPATAAEHAAIWPHVAKLATRGGLRIDPSTKDASRFWYRASRPAEGEPIFLRMLGPMLSVDRLLAAAEAARVVPDAEPAPAAAEPRRASADDHGDPKRYARKALDSAIDRLRGAPKGQRNPDLAREAYGMGQAYAAAGLDLEEARAALRAAIGSWDPGYMKKHLETLDRQLAEGAKSPRDIPPPRKRRGEAPSLRVVRPGEEPRAEHDQGDEDTKRRRRHEPGPGDFERGDHVELATRMLAELGPREDLVGDEGRAYAYQASGGLYLAIERGEQSRIVQGFAGLARGDKGHRLEVCAGDVGGAIRLAYDQIERPAFFAQAPAGLAFSNGFVRVAAEGVELRAHDRDNRARAGYRFAFDARVRADRFLAFLGEVFEPDPDRVQRIAFLQEWLGAALLGLAPRWGLALVLLGEGANGKSTLGRIVTDVMPEGTTCAIAPQLWGSEYRRADLLGRRLNVVAELPEGDILDSASFKAIITGDPVDARRIREAPFTLRPIAAHVFSANRLPGARDLSEGFWRRLVVIRFSRRFEKAAADPHLADRILATEAPGIVAWMLEGAARLLARGCFEVPASSAGEVAAWKCRADVVAMFVGERTVDAKRDDERETCARFYESFRLFAETNGFVIPNARTVGERMASLGKGSVRGTGGVKLYPVRLLRLGEHDEEGLES